MLSARSALTLVSSFPEGVITCDPQDRVSFMNPAAARLLGLDPEHAVGLARTALCAHVGIPAVLSQSPQYITSQHYSGYAQLLDVPAPMRRPDLASLLVLHQETTDTAALWNLIGTLGHDLRGPLATLSGFADLFGRGMLGALTSDQQEVLAIMQDRLLVLRRTVTQYLTLACIEQGNITLHAMQADLGEAIAAAVAACQRNYPTRVRHVEMLLPEAPLVLHTDGGIVEQILHQLLDNAWRYTAPDLAVGVRVVLDGDTITIAVESAGSPLPHDYLQRLFVEPPRFDPQPQQLPAGTGLGLIIAAKLAGLLSGHMTYHYDPTFGHTFALSLPRG